MEQANHPVAAATPTGELHSTALCRRRLDKMSAENDRHKQLIAALLARIQGLEQQVARYTPPPQVRAEMAVPSGSMRPVLAAVDGRTLVIVAPPGGFADPDEAYGRIVHHYADEALP